MLCVPAYHLLHKGARCHRYADRFQAVNVAFVETNTCVCYYKCCGMAGAWGVRTRAITAGTDGTLEWTERLIIELQGPIGTLHML